MTPEPSVLPQNPTPGPSITEQQIMEFDFANV
jgi:hypothetical protein